MGLQTSCSLCDKPYEEVPPEREVEDRVAAVRDLLMTHATVPEKADASKAAAANTKRRLSTTGAIAGNNGTSGTSSMTVTKSPSVETTKDDRIVSCSSTQRLLIRAGLEQSFIPDELGQRRAALITSLTESQGGKRASFKEKHEEVLCPPGQENDEARLLEWMQVDCGIGWACKKGMKANAPNQDSFSILAVEKEFVLIGVYDGHGPFGHDVSQFVRQEMVKNVVQHPRRTSAISDVFREVFELVQKQMAKQTGLDAWESGTTCTMVYLDLQKCTATFAHVGDARSVLGSRKAGAQEFVVEDMTIDHKPNLPEERRRIESADPPGRVLFDGYVNYRVFVQNGMYPGLNMSRALGDIWAHRDAGVSGMPDVRTVDLKPLLEANKEVTLLACTDGVWEFMEGPEAFRLIEKDGNLDPHMIVNRLALRAWELWMADSAGEICDDITAVCAHLHCFDWATDA